MTTYPALYKKTVEHLDSPELFLIYKSFKGFFPKGCTKQVLLLLIEDSSPGFLADKKKFYFFKQKDSKSVHFLKSKIDDPAEEHTLRELSPQHRNEVDQLLKDSKNDKEEEKDGDDEDSNTILISDATPSEDHKPDHDHKSEDMINFLDKHNISIPSTIRESPIDRLEHIVNKMEVPRRSSDFKFTQKLKFDPDLGVESFLIAVENYSAANNIQDQQKWIALAKAGLMNSEQGLSAQSTLEPEDEYSWDRFKKRIINTIGYDPSYYRSIFRNYRRKSSERVGLSFANLVQSYRRAFNKNGPLSQDDRTHILHQFICGQEGQLKTSLELEEGRLTYSNIIERASQIERALGYPNAHSSYEINAIPSTPKQVSRNQPSEIECLVTLMKEMMASQASQMAQHTAILSKMAEPRRGGGGNKSNSSYREDVKIAAGYCIQKLKNGSCSKGECRYKHDEAPESIRKHFSTSA